MRTRVDADEVAKRLAARFLEPEICRAGAAALPSRPTPDEVGCCEMAFARAAIVRHVVGDVLPVGLAEPLNAAIMRELAGAFGGAHTAATEAHYGSRTLAEVAADAMSVYQPAAFFATRVADTMMTRLGMARVGLAKLTLPARPPAALVAVFTDLTEEVVLFLSRARMI